MKHTLPFPEGLSETITTERQLRSAQRRWVRKQRQAAFQSIRQYRRARNSARTGEPE